MDLPTPAGTLVAFAAFVRSRLAEVGTTLAPLLRRDDADSRTGRGLGTVVVGATAPFALTSQARARLLRQAYASGLLTAGEATRALEAERLGATEGQQFAAMDGERLSAWDEGPGDPPRIIGASG